MLNPERRGRQAEGTAPQVEDNIGNVMNRRHVTNESPPLNDAETHSEKLPKDRCSSNRHIRINFNSRMRKSNRQYRMPRQSLLRPTAIGKGGQHHYGDIRQRHKGTCRIFFQNLGGYPTTRTASETALKEVNEFRADYIGLQETKLNCNHHEMMNRVKRDIRNTLGTIPTFKSNNDSFTSSYWKPGGTASLLMRRFRSHKNKTWTDPASIIQRTRIDNQEYKISIINAYNPRNRTGPAGSYYQTLNTIRKTREWEDAEGVEDYFYTTIAQIVKDDIKLGYKIVIGGDFNCDNSADGEMAKHFLPLSLINITSPPGTTSPATYKRGRKTLDHIWITPNLSGHVTKFGYLPYDLGFDSDHRGTFVDLHCTGTETPIPTRKRRRKLKSKHPKNTSIYLRQVHKALKGHNIGARIAQLEGRTELSPQQKHELDKIDQTLTGIMLHAESLLQPFRTTDSFSKKLHEAKQTRHYWRKILHLRVTTSHYALQKYLSLHVETNILLPRPTIIKKISEASSRIEMLRKNNRAHREKTLEEIIRQEEQRSGGQHAAQGPKAILNTERSIRRHNILRQLKHPAGYGAGKLEVPSGCHTVDRMWDILKEEGRDIEKVPWRTIPDEQETTEYLLRWCIRHFGQASSTPLASRTWKNQLDPRNANNVLEEICNGTFPTPEGCPPELEEFLRAARRPEGVIKTPFSMTYQHFKHFCIKQDERKESSPSGLHYGHLKAFTLDDSLLRLKYKILEIAFGHGVMLKRWTTLREVLIPKKKRSYIHKFRNITLVEGDLQYLMKAVWSQALMRAITPILNKSQNSLQGKVTQSSILSHRIAMDTLFVNGEDCVIIENDAVNCFDRIIPVIAALAFYRLGLPSFIIGFFLSFLEAARHHIIVNGKPSKQSYANSENTPIMGSGQGTGWAGPAWFAVADIILTCLTSNQPGMYLKSPNGLIVDFRAAEANVDDARQGINSAGVEKYNKEHLTNLDIGEAAQQASQKFERYLTLTGGRLALDKTMCYSLFPDHGHLEKRYRPAIDTRVQIVLTENFNTRTKPLNMYEPDEAHKLLGVLTDPASTMKEQITYMRGHSKEWNTKILNAPIPSTLKRLSFQTELAPKLRYPLPAITLTERDCELILSPALPSIKHGLGLAKTVNTRVIFFPYAYGGYNTMDLHIEHLAEQARYIIQHIRNDDSTGKRTVISTEISQLEAGTATSITRNGKILQLEYLTTTVLTSLMCQLWTMKAELWYEHWVPEGQTTIMDEMRDKTGHRQELLAINTCRTWLKVHTLADISTIDGSRVHPGYAEGQRVHRSSWSWPRWRPSPQSWGIWKAAIRSYISQRFPIKPEKSTHQIQQSWRTADGTEVETKGNTYRATTTLRKQRLIPAPSKTFKEVPCDVYEKNNALYLMPGDQPDIPVIRQKPSEKGFLETLIAEEPTYEYIFRELPHRYEEQTAIADLMIQECLVAGTDGGDDQNGRLVMSITLASDDLTEMHVSGHDVYGYPRDSGRAEIVGLCAVILFLNHLRKWHDIPRTSTVTIYCDNSEAVNFANSLWIGTTPKWADTRNIEVKRTIKRALEEAGRSLRIEHVHGHQDETTPRDELTLPARINIICDRKCSRQLSDQPRVQAPDGRRDMMREARTCLAIDGSPVTGAIKDALLKKKYKSEVARHLNMHTQEFESVDWEGHARAIGTERSPALTRIVWGHHPTRAHLKLTGQHPSGLCPLCGRNDQSEHFFHCVPLNKSREYKAIRDTMRHQANSRGAPDHFTNLIAEIITGNYSAANNPPEFADHIYREQERIGWCNFKRGRLTKQWSQIKTTDSSGRLQPDSKWRSLIIRTILQWTLRKWELRCKLCAGPEAVAERNQLYSQCQKWWENKDNVHLLNADSHLKRERWKPLPAHTPDHMRVWLQARTTAEKAYKRYQPMKNQPSIHRWLVRKEG